MFPYFLCGIVFMCSLKFTDFLKDIIYFENQLLIIFYSESLRCVEITASNILNKCMELKLKVLNLAELFFCFFLIYS